MTQILGIGALILISAILVLNGVRIVPEYRRVVIFRLGRCRGARGPGMVWLIPFMDRPVRTDLREEYFEVPPQTCITADNASVSIDFLVYDKVIDPERSVLAVEDFTGAARGLAVTTLRALVGAMDLDDVLSKREEINRLLHEKLDDITDRWGVRIMAVEIREVLPPDAIADAMTLQMAAERSRRATVAEADGQRQAKITVAEGEKQANILRAEGERQATVERAKGFALALKEINASAKDIDTNTLTLQYLDALTTLGSNEGTKFVIPTELVTLAQPLLTNALKSRGESVAASG
jgi:regulator of protease activity HflC (stomatin/prohibitin superfamily)